MKSALIGARIPRLEDPALLRGRARFVDDLRFPGLAHGSFVRSGEAHARIRRVDAGRARAAPGVLAVLTLDDIRPHVTSARMPLGQPSAAIRHVLDPPVLADGEVRHVGEPVALVIADHPYRAEDAASLVAIDYETLPAAIDCRAALAPGAAPAHAELADNLVARLDIGYGDCEAAFARAAHVVDAAMHQHKGLGQAIECRGVLARPDPNDGGLTVWSGTQMPHRGHMVLCQLLGCEEDALRVVAPDVGGGFGPKFVFYAEEAAVAVAARIVGRPVKWIEDRREHFTATTQERDQFWDMEMALDADGRMLAVRGSLIHDHGAYTPYGVNLPHNGATNLLGPYVLPGFSLTVSIAATNKVPVTPVRGAGRPQGTFVMERLLDRAAAGLGIDRTEIRRRNLIQPAAMPYAVPVRNRDGKFMTYDSGDYPAALAAALEAAGHDGFAARQEAARAAGRHIGIGVANYVEGTRPRPVRVRPGQDRPVRPRQRGDRRDQPGPGARDRAGPGLRRCARPRRRRRPRRRGRYRRGGPGARRLRQPSGGHRRILGPSGERGAARQSAHGRGPSSWRPRARTSRSPAGGSGCAACRTCRSAWARSPACWPASRASPCRAGRRRGWRRSRPSSRRRSPSATAATSPRSRSISTPAP